jgi:hypothetical protein
MDAPAFEPRGNATLAPRHRAAAAGDAGLRARLGNFVLQVPLPTPPRARSRFVPFLGSLGRHTLRCRSWPPSWPDAGAFRVHARAHAGSPPLRSCAPQHARVLAGEVQAGPLVLFPLCPTLSRHAPLLAMPPWPYHGGLPCARGCRGVERPPQVVLCTPHRQPLRTPHASVPGRGFHVRRRPFCADPSSATSYAAPPLCGQLRA